MFGEAADALVVEPVSFDMLSRAGFLPNDAFLMPAVDNLVLPVFLIGPSGAAVTDNWWAWAFASSLSACASDLICSRDNDDDGVGDWDCCVDAFLTGDILLIPDIDNLSLPA